MICEKKGILIINICNRFLTKSDEFDDVNQDNELKEHDINLSPIEEGNNIFIRNIVETRLEIFKQNEFLLKKAEEDKRNYSLVKSAIFLQKTQLRK